MLQCRMPVNIIRQHKTASVLWSHEWLPAWRLYNFHWNKLHIELLVPQEHARECTALCYYFHERPNINSIYLCQRHRMLSHQLFKMTIKIWQKSLCDVDVKNTDTRCFVTQEMNTKISLSWWLISSSLSGVHTIFCMYFIITMSNLLLSRHSLQILNCEKCVRFYSKRR